MAEPEIGTFSRVDVVDCDGNVIITMQPGIGRVIAGGEGRDGSIYVADRSLQPTIRLDGEHGNVMLGGVGQGGDLVLKTATEQQSIHLDGQTGNITLNEGRGNRTIHLDGRYGNAILGGGGQDGDLVLKTVAEQPSIHLDGEIADIVAGDGDKFGTLVLKDGRGNTIIHMDASTGDINAGGAGRDGNLHLWNSTGTTIALSGRDAWISLGAYGQDGEVFVKNADGRNTIVLNGATGQISHAGGDAAEDFDVADTSDAEPGAVMVIDDEERLRLSDRPYDKRVAGVVSGAGSQNPGIVLDKDPSKERRVPVALAGKVYCKVDADESPIEVGDLLTTAASPGHAMKATDPLKAFGAVIGKALRPLEKGQGLIPVLVALQ